MLAVEANCHPTNCESVTTTAEDHADHDEYQYLDLIRKVLKHGKTRQDRTGTIVYCVKYFMLDLIF